MHQAALKLVAEHGFNQVTVEQIAEKAEVSERTLFNYWLSKEAVVLGIEPQESEHLIESLKRRPLNESPAQTLRAILREKAERSKGIDSKIRALRREVMRREPHLAHIFMSENSKVQNALVEHWAQRLAHEHDASQAHDLAVIYVSSLTAMVRSAQTIAFKRDIELAKALELLFAYLDQGLIKI